MSEKRFTLSKTEFDVEYGVGNFLLDNGKRMTYDGVVDLLNNQDEQIRQLEEEKIELMEDNACQCREIQKWESENEELRKRVFLFEKGITIYLQKEEQMKLHDYVDLEMMRWRFDDE